MKEEKREKNKVTDYEWEMVCPGTKRFMAYIAAIAVRKMKTYGGAGNGF